jgi:hypothetical protein
VSQLDYGNYHSFVVDNGSQDSSIAAINRAHPQTEVLSTGQNLGYAAGNNVGIRHALNRGAQYILILNNDTLVERSMLSQLVGVAESNSGFGMVGPTVFCTNPADRIFAAGSYILWRQGRICHRGMFQARDLYTLPVDPSPADFLVGCGLLVSRRMIESVGLLDEEYFLNFEDVEWALRARNCGFRIMHVPQAILWHKYSASLGVDSTANTYFMTRNGLRFFWQNSPRHLRWIAVPLILLRTLRTIGAWSIKSQYRGAAFRKRRSANLRALLDFLMGRSGPMPETLQSFHGE